ncbi:replication factor C subunit 3-like [Camellia sinensis]|uniref:replication factor C subunit 3-like n=1 Tax=Camellia sinensis TaxID=4442 RepID=UPI001036B7EC|nr:replication factor C subunit 3-like [Camellia sinensis]
MAAVFYNNNNNDDEDDSCERVANGGHGSGGGSSSGDDGGSSSDGDKYEGEVVSSIKVSLKISPQHVEVNLSEVKGYEKHVIVELMQETINRLAKKALQCNKDNCRVIILYEADKLSADALLYIKWQLGRHKGCSKVFFCCSDASKLQPIMSLCTVVKLLPPSNEEIVKVLEFIAKQEGIELPHQLADKIAINAKNNLRQAIRSLEATWQAK